jgi:tetratricopeptide (TPR) repeat protein
MMRDIGARRDEVYCLTYLARALEQADDIDKAAAAHRAALSRRREQKQRAASLENVAGLARIALARGDLQVARAYAEEVLAHVREHGLSFIERPFQVYQTCVPVLQACQELDMAREVLGEAHQALVERAERIADAALRRSFLEQVPEHREIVTAWEKAAPA